MINKTTENYAKKRGLSLEVYTKDNGAEYLWIFSDEDSEPDLILEIEGNGEYNYYSDLLDLEVREELPAHIWNEKHLREVLDFLAKELAE